MSEVDGHRLSLERAMTALGLGWDAWPEVLGDPRLDPEARLSGVLVLLAEEESVPPSDSMHGGEDSQHDWLGRPKDPWQALPLARLPWSTATAAIAVRSVTRSRAYEERCMAIALRGAKQVCDAGLADVALLDALAACRARLDDDGDDVPWRYRVEEMRALAHRAVAGATPPDLLDLSPLADGDAWVGPARAAAGDLPGGEIASLVRLLVDLGTRKPPRKWLHDVGTALEHPAARTLLERWLALAAATDVVPQLPGSRIGDCPGALFVTTNADVVRAAVWAASVLVDEEWPVPHLGALARRGAAPNGAPRFPEALSLKVASSAVDALATRGGAMDRQELTELLEDLQRRDLVKRIGVALHRTDEAAEREQELRRVKARDVRRRASPAPRRARGALESQLRAELGPVLRSLGFTGGPGVWRRRRAEGVDVIGTTGHQDPRTGATTVRVWFGVRLDVAHPADDPRRVEVSNVSDGDLDVLMHDREAVLPGTPEDPLSAGPAMVGTGVRIRDVLAPFLDGLHDDSTLRALLESDVGVPPGAFVLSRIGSSARVEVLGMLALGRGERAAAVEHLQDARDRAASWEERYPDAVSRAMTAYWTRQLERARDLP